MKRLKLKTLFELSGDIYFLLESGIPIVKSLEIISKQKSYKVINKVIDEILNNIKSGNSIYKSFEDKKEYFPFEFVNCLKMGENSDNIKEAFKNLSYYYEEEYENLKKFREATAYPKIVLTMGSLVIIFLINFVIPKFSETLSSLGGELPFITLFFINSNLFFKKYCIFLLIILLIFIFLFIKYMENIKNNKYIEFIRIKIPLFKNYYIKKEIYKYSERVYLMLSSGFSIYSGLKDSIEGCKNRYFKDIIIKIIKDIDNGEGITEAFKKENIFEEKFIQLLNLGEESSNMEFVFKKTCFLYGRDIKNINKKAISFIEPCSVIILAFMVSLIILSIILPMFSIMDTLG